VSHPLSPGHRRRNFVIHDDMSRRMRQESKRRGISEGELVRRAIHRILKEYEAAKHPLTYHLEG